MPSSECFDPFGYPVVARIRAAIDRARSWPAAGDDVVEPALTGRGETFVHWHGHTRSWPRRLLCQMERTITAAVLLPRSDKTFDTVSRQIWVRPNPKGIHGR